MRDSPAAARLPPSSIPERHDDPEEPVPTLGQAAGAGPADADAADGARPRRRHRRRARGPLARRPGRRRREPVGRPDRHRPDAAAPVHRTPGHGARHRQGPPHRHRGDPVHADGHADTAGRGSRRPHRAAAPRHLPHQRLRGHHDAGRAVGRPVGLATDAHAPRCAHRVRGSHAAAGGGRCARAALGRRHGTGTAPARRAWHRPSEPSARTACDAARGPAAGLRHRPAAAGATEHRAGRHRAFRHRAGG